MKPLLSLMFCFFHTELIIHAIESFVKPFWIDPLDLLYTLFDLPTNLLAFFVPFDEPLLGARKVFHQCLAISISKLFLESAKYQRRYCDNILLVLFSNLILQYQQVQHILTKTHKLLEPILLGLFIDGWNLVRILFVWLSLLISSSWIFYSSAENDLFECKCLHVPVDWYFTSKQKLTFTQYLCLCWNHVLCGVVAHDQARIVLYPRKLILFVFRCHEQRRHSHQLVPAQRHMILHTMIIKQLYGQVQSLLFESIFFVNGYDPFDQGDSFLQCYLWITKERIRCLIEAEEFLMPQKIVAVDWCHFVK